MIDFHCHLDLYPDPNAIVERAESEGIGVLSVTNTPSAWQGTSKLAVSKPTIRTALGLHPQLAKQRKHELRLFDELLTHTEFVGEIGLDGTPPYRPFWQDQLDVLDHILKSCEAAGGKVISAHTRQAVVPFLERLSIYPGAGLAILHWFSGTKGQLTQAIEADCWFSVGPSMLAGAKGRDLVQAMPRSRVLLETDGPFAQLHGAPLSPWDVTLAIRPLADAWQMEPDGALAQLTLNEQVLKTSARALNPGRAVGR